MAILYKYNFFITMYKTIFEHLQDPDNVAKIWIILNLQIYLLLKERINCYYNNLSIINVIIIIILDEYNEISF